MYHVDWDGAVANLILVVLVYLAVLQPVLKVLKTGDDAEIKRVVLVAMTTALMVWITSSAMADVLHILDVRYHRIPAALGTGIVIISWAMLWNQTFPMVAYRLLARATATTGNEIAIEILKKSAWTGVLLGLSWVAAMVLAPFPGYLERSANSFIRNAEAATFSETRAHDAAMRDGAGAVCAALARAYVNFSVVQPRPQVLIRSRAVIAAKQRMRGVLTQYDLVEADMHSARRCTQKLQTYELAQIQRLQDDFLAAYRASGAPSIEPAQIALPSTSNDKPMRVSDLQIDRYFRSALSLKQLHVVTSESNPIAIFITIGELMALILLFIETLKKNPSSPPPISSPSEDRLV